MHFGSCIVYRQIYDKFMLSCMPKDKTFLCMHIFARVHFQSMLIKCIMLCVQILIRQMCVKFTLACMPAETTKVKRHSYACTFLHMYIFKACKLNAFCIMHATRQIRDKFTLARMATERTLCYIMCMQVFMRVRVLVCPSNSPAMFVSGPHVILSLRIQTWLQGGAMVTLPIPSAGKGSRARVGLRHPYRSTGWRTRGCN